MKIPKYYSWPHMPRTKQATVANISFANKLITPNTWDAIQMEQKLNSKYRYFYNGFSLL